MARINDGQANQLRSIPNYKRARILYLYLACDETLADIAEDVFDDYSRGASQRASMVTRAFGFHRGDGRGEYSHIPEDVFDDFVEEYAPEDYDEGLDVGTFDDFLRQNGYHGCYSSGSTPSNTRSPRSSRGTSTPPSGPGRMYGNSGSSSSSGGSRGRGTGSSSSGGGSSYSGSGYGGNSGYSGNGYSGSTSYGRGGIKGVPPPPIGGSGSSGGGSYGRGSGRGGYSGGSFSMPSLPDLPFSYIIVLVLVVALLWGGKQAMNWGRNTVNNVTSFLSSEYDAQIFEYEGLEFLGNQRFNKPEGACMRLDGGTDFTLGFFDSGELHGYGARASNDGADLQIGSFKQEVLDGYGIHRSNGVNYVADFKKGVANGYGYCFDNGVEQFVKFKKATAGSPDFASGVTVIAERNGDKWYKPNGDELTLKDNTYKDMIWLREGLIAIDDMEFYFSVEDGDADYEHPDARIVWDAESCSYDTIRSDDEEGTYLNYTYGELFEGRHQFKRGRKLMYNTFSTEISID